MNYVYNDPMPTTGHVYASGFFSGSSNWFYMSFICDSGGSAPIERRQAAEVWASFDDLSLTYMTPVPEQLVANNDFSSGDIIPWNVASSDGESPSSVSDGRLIVTSNANVDTYIYQFLGRSTNIGQTVSLQADLDLTISDETTSCSLTVTVGQPPVFQVSNIDHSGNFAIDNRVTLSEGSTVLFFLLSCTDTNAGQTIMALDNVYLTINPENIPVESPDAPTTTSTISEVSSSTPTPTSGPRQVIVNNDFENGMLNPWYTGSYNGGSEPGIVEEGRAIVKFTTLSAQTESHAYFEQSLPGITSDDVGKSARVQADVFVNVGEPGTSCFILIMSSDDLFWRIASITTSQTYHVDETIVLQHATPMVTLYGGCSGDGSSSYIAWDNIYYWVDVPAATSTTATTEMSSTTTMMSSTTTEISTPTATRRQLIVNNNFESGSFSPWTEVRYSDLSDPVTVEDGRAIARIPRIVTTNYAQGSFDQQLPSLSQADIGKLATVQADVYVNIADVGSHCYLQIYSVDDLFWSSGDTTASQTFHIDNQITLQYASPGISVYWACYGSGTTTSVAIDNLYYYVDEPGSTVSSTSTSSDTSSTASPSPSVRATVSCPANDAQTYTNDDGSQYMIVCGQNYDGNNIVGINPVSSASFSACVDLCMYQGTQCQGVSWFEAQANCFLKTKMSPSANPNAVVYSAIRINGPTGGPSASRIIANGDFATDLSSWTTSSTNQQGGSFVWDNGRAYVLHPLLTIVRSRSYADLYQIHTADAHSGSRLRGQRLRLCGLVPKHSGDQRRSDVLHDCGSQHSSGRRILQHPIRRGF
jgi:hypothetical protein